MIGNDIVDLTFAKLNSRWQEQRFLDKLFSKEEQSFILSDANRFENIWRLWSMKESAYKISNRENGLIQFNPKNFRCKINSETLGKVYFKNVCVKTTTEVTSTYVQTTACLISEWKSEIFRFRNFSSELQQQETYQRTVQVFANLKNQPHSLFNIVKNKSGIPQLFRGDILQKEMLSMSHHGRYAACAITLE